MINRLSIAVAIKEFSRRIRAGIYVYVCVVVAIAYAKTEAENSEFSVYSPLHSFK